MAEPSADGEEVITPSLPIEETLTGTLTGTLGSPEQVVTILGSDDEILDVDMTDPSIPLQPSPPDSSVGGYRDTDAHPGTPPQLSYVPRPPTLSIQPPEILDHYSAAPTSPTGSDAMDQTGSPGVLIQPNAPTVPGDAEMETQSESPLHVMHFVRALSLVPILSTNRHTTGRWNVAC